MADFVTIRDKIKANLTTITGFAFIADFHDPNITGYPAVTFDVSDEDSEFITNKENLRTITYAIVLYQEIKGKGLSEAKRILDEIAIQVIDVFETDFNLGGEVDWCVPLTGGRGQFEGVAGATFFQELNIQCKFSKLVIT